MPEPPSASGATGAAVAQPQNGGDDPPPPPSNWQGTAFPACVIFLILLGIVYVGRWADFQAATSWLWILGLMVALFFYLGWLISKRPLGILVNTRNLMSLARFQIVAWSLVIISAFLAIAFKRIGHVADPLRMPMDRQLWALLGISTASLVGSPLILQNKAGQKADDGQIQAAAETLGEDPNEIKQNSDGKLYANPKVEDARVTDLFQGDEIGNAGYVDIAKVQMFLFTLIIVLSYCSDIYALLASDVSPDKLAMPRLSASVVALLGISHAGYLTSKTADHTPTTPN